MYYMLSIFELRLSSIETLSESPSGKTCSGKANRGIAVVGEQSGRTKLRYSQVNLRPGTEHCVPFQRALALLVHTVEPLS